MVEFNDRRKADHIPTEDDYSTPLTWTSLVEANKRFRQTGVSGRIVGQDKATAEKIIKDASRNRSYGETVGEYLDVLNTRAREREQHGSLRQPKPRPVREPDNGEPSRDEDRF